MFFCKVSPNIVSQLKTFGISGHFHSVHVLGNYSLERFNFGTESSVEILRISGFL